MREGIDTSTVGQWLELLTSSGMIGSFDADGKTWGYVVHWQAHQQISGRERDIGTRRPSPPGHDRDIPGNVPSEVPGHARAASPTPTPTTTPTPAAAAVVARNPASSDGARQRIQGFDSKRIQRAVANADALEVIAAFGGTRDAERDAEWTRDAAGMLIAELVAVLWLAQHDRRAIRQPSGLRKERDDWDRNPIEDKRDTVRLAFEQLGIPMPPRKPPPTAEQGAA
jgi:hypothetical protein